MQIILVSRHLKAARTFTIMPWHVVATLLVFLALVFSTSALFSWLSVHLRLPLIEDLLVKLQLQESQKTRNYLDNNLQLMATRLGELQGQVLQLDALGDRVSGLAGIKREASVGIVKPSQGGPYLPAPTSPNAMQSEMDRLADEVERHSDDLVYLEFKLLEKRVKDRLLPTMLPVKDATLGSSFGYRADPIAGLRSMHEALVARIDAFGAYETAPKKGYVSLRRKKQFAMIGPATKSEVEIGVNAKDDRVAAVFTRLPPGGMCQFKTRIASVEAVDDALLAAIRIAYDEAG